MRRNALILTLAAISLTLISTAAFSQPYGQGAERHYSRHHDSSQARHTKRHDTHHRHRYHDRRNDGRDKPDHRASPHHRKHAHVQQEHFPYHARIDRTPAYRFHRGDSLPRSYRHHHHVVHHWHHHHLRHPPHGHHWVQIDGDYLLIAIATGVIVDILITR